jgi:hypothetical protein
MAEVHQRPRGRKDGDPSRAVRSLEAFVAAAGALLEAWHPILDGTAYPPCLHDFNDFVVDLGEWLASIQERAEVQASDVPPLDFTDPKGLRDWLRSLDSNFHDLLAAADDATRPPARRELGRATARANILEARRAMRGLLEAATRGAPEVPK